MAIKRTDKINEEIVRELAKLLRGMKDPRMKRGLPSITRVETASDLVQAKVYLSVMGTREEEAGVFAALKSASGFLRRELAASMRLRHTPELRFIRDEALGRGADVLSILNEIDIPGEGSISEGDHT
jgi:ribosome-binding factor A